MIWGRPRQKVLTAPPAFPGGTDGVPAIRTGEQMAEALFGERLTPDEYLKRFYPQAPVPPINEVVATARPLVARVNSGHWIASCDCGGIGTPSPGGLVFMAAPLVWCLRCGNGSTGRGWRPVIVPAPETRELIERVLLCRPKIEDRNWEPSESLADLIRQNREHGDPIPEVRNGLRHPD